METKYYWFDIETELPADPEEKKRLIASMPESRQKKIRRFKAQADADRSLGAGILIQRIYRELCRRETDTEAEEADAGRTAELNDLILGTTADGKPYFRDCPSVHFNVSHSGRYVFAAAG